ncbi:MAG TPA: 16S rRNA (guanine(527)-N(7))-methyltransferase RsmG [Candidatus Dormibacteraeota bacterium]|nr:16S rRNA (guanine(527)-N(7))-methyltransferase RsmG [Candidatus Dormibacteraeota bacterium]
MIEAWPGLVSGPAAELIDDSLVLLPFLGDASRLVDVGSGGGLPGLPLKLLRPDLQVTLIESDQDKAAFLVQAAARLRLPGVEVVNRPAEEAGQDARYREAFDVAVARALAPMPVLAELCLPLVRVGGRLLAQKTEREDMGVAHAALDLLGGMLEAVNTAPSELRGGGTIVVVRKVAPTPAMYPRRPGLPRRKPL